jgi:hypothetical protein
MFPWDFPSIFPGLVVQEQVWQLDIPMDHRGKV